MKQFRASGLASAVLALVLCCGQAQANEPPIMPAAAGQSTEQLALTLSHQFISKLDISGLVDAMTPTLPNSFGGMKGRPGWPGLMKKALTDEIQADLPEFEILITRVLAKNFTSDELKVGIEVMSGPAGDEISGMMKASALHQPQAEFSSNAKAALERLAPNPAARTFFEKLGHLSQGMGQAGRDVGFFTAAGALRRFGETAQAEERARLSLAH
jgi:hypothetical protein